MAKDQNILKRTKKQKLQKKVFPRDIPGYTEHLKKTFWHLFLAFFQAWNSYTFVYAFMLKNKYPIKSEVSIFNYFAQSVVAYLVCLDSSASCVKLVAYAL